MDDALIWTDGRVGRIRLNRPRQINALTLPMVQAISAALAEFSADPGIRAIAIDGAGERGLCSGGDVRAVRQDILENGAEAAAAFWRTEYAMNAQIAALTKPYAAFMDGVVMGGGVGVSAYGSIRLTTPRTRLAMPETGIGLFPDVGTLYLLSRAPGELGTHMALTGEAVGGADAVAAGIADAVIDPEGWDRVLAALQATPAGEPVAATRDRVLGAAGAQAAPAPELAGRVWIAECYAGEDPGAILDRLRAHPDPEARAAGDLLATRSPLSVAVTLAALRRAATLPSLEAVLDQDLQLVTHFMRDSDFLEGVRALLVDKDNSPIWQHDNVSQVSAERVGSYFA